MTSVATSFGVSLPAVAMAPLHQFQPDIHSFLVGTNSTYQPNRILHLDFHEGANHMVDTYQYNHPNEVLSITTTSEYPDRFVTVSKPQFIDYLTTQDTKVNHNVATLYQLPTQQELAEVEDPNNVDLKVLSTFPDASHVFSSQVSSSTTTTAAVAAARANQQQQQQLPSVWNNPHIDVLNPTNIISIGAAPTAGIDPQSVLTGYNIWGEYFNTLSGGHQPQQILNSQLNDHTASHHGIQRVIWQSSALSGSSNNNNNNNNGGGITPDTSNNNSTNNNNYALGQYSNGLALYDLNNNSDIRTISHTSGQFINSKIRDVCWNRHRYGEQFYVATNNNIYNYDCRIMRPTFSLIAPHGQHYINKIDTNYIKNYSLLTAGDDGTVALWDSRKPTQPLIAVRFFTSAITMCEFNIYHDNLICAGSLDGTVALFSISSYSSSSSIINNGESNGSGNNTHNPIMFGGNNSSNNNNDLYNNNIHKPNMTRPSSLSITSNGSGRLGANAGGFGNLPNTARGNNNNNNVLSNYQVASQFDPNLLVQRVEPPLDMSNNNNNITATGVNHNTTTAARNQRNASARQQQPSNRIQPDNTPQQQRGNQQQRGMGATGGNNNIKKLSIQEIYENNPQYVPSQHSISIANYTSNTNMAIPTSSSGNGLVDTHNGASGRGRFVSGSNNNNNNNTSINGSNANNNNTVGDALMSYHNEHSTAVIAGCWSSSSPWHYASLSTDGVIIINQVVPENEQYKLLL